MNTSSKFLKGIPIRRFDRIDPKVQPQVLSRGSNNKSANSGTLSFNQLVMARIISSESAMQATITTNYGGPEHNPATRLSNLKKVGLRCESVKLGEGGPKVISTDPGDRKTRVV